MIDCGYHGNETSADLYMAVFVHPHRQPNFKPKMKVRKYLFPSCLFNSYIFLSRDLSITQGVF